MWDTWRVQGAVNMPILSCQLAVRLVGSYAKSDGYMRNGACYGRMTDFTNTKYRGISGCADGKRSGGEDVFNGRAKLLWEPTTDISVLLQYERLRDNSDTPVPVNTIPDDPEFLFYTLGVGGVDGDPIDNGGVTLRRGVLIDMHKGHQVNVDG